jgi:hypothetical protein
MTNNDIARSGIKMGGGVVGKKVGALAGCTSPRPSRPAPWASPRS